MAWDSSVSWTEKQETVRDVATQVTFTCSKLTIETLQRIWCGICSKLTIKTLERFIYLFFILIR